MIIRFILFIGIFLAALLVSHYLLYLSVVKAFGITSVNLKYSLMWIFAFLAISFFLSAFLLRLHGNFLFNIYYFISAFWIGLLVNLLMACGLMWLIFLVTKIFSIDINLAITATILFIVSFGFSVFGIWNALNPKINEINISLKNLPDEWKGKKIVQLSDVHLGPIHRAGFINKIKDKVNALDPDLILITGDLFDGMDGDLEPLIKPLSELKAKKGVFFVTGNHEGYLGLECPIKLLRRTGIMNLENRMLTIHGLQLIGLSYPLFGTDFNPDKIFSSSDYKPEKPSILMYHTPTSISRKYSNRGNQQWMTYWAPDTDFEYVKEKGVDLQLSGHAHNGQLFPFNLLVRAIFGKFHYGLNKIGAFQIYTTSGVGTWGPPMRTCTDAEIPVFRLK